MHINLIGPYSDSIRKHYPGGLIIKKDVILTCMIMINPATGWFKLSEVPCFDLNEVAIVNNEPLEKYSERLSQLFNQKWLYRCPGPHKFLFYNGSEF